ncbi:hypothetical protein CHGG_03304 [Chaetomium globosum CBS 148.51]|uniref:Prephenate dehydratase domain-containing protein n=1 Tax=Chaetomium globosum (strain ATCC 6205 / CBS 148.51 / DSM 1962 / NBRC 6347 / NRRL 1970) TaxID=306901 RepID=Q2H900_CHAGB|nr:uncharacterized protein CHGG_03304 [Chaetomium globosum CBS 148.51]EAQ91369.1 hypothetical protein CHGG_03304 [Chaetomium globosum CBS 148.51]
MTAPSTQQAAGEGGANTGTTVAFLGPFNSYSHQATKIAFPEAKWHLEPTTTIKEVFDRVQSQHAPHGVVPFENSTHGTVTFTLDNLADRAGEKTPCWLGIREHPHVGLSIDCYENRMLSGMETPNLQSTMPLSPQEVKLGEWLPVAGRYSPHTLRLGICITSSTPISNEDNRPAFGQVVEASRCPPSRS